jgi:hypothetical protein
MADELLLILRYPKDLMILMIPSILLTRDVAYPFSVVVQEMHIMSFHFASCQTDLLARDQQVWPIRHFDVVVSSL